MKTFTFSQYLHFPCERRQNGAGRSQQVSFAAHVFIATQRLRDQFSFPELRAEVHVHELFVTGKSRTLCNAAA